MTKVLIRLSISLVVATGVCSHGLKKKSLSSSGAVAAFCMGVLHMTCGWTFGLVLLCFFATSSKLTKFHQDEKAKLDAHIKPGGQRTAVQVLCNSLTGGAAAAVCCIVSAGLGSSSALTVTASAVTQVAAWCAFLGHYACCCADTWASELGMLSSTAPRLITNLARRVPPGVNGGVTAVGLAASAAGGLCMGAAVAAAGWLTGELQPLGGVIGKCLLQLGVLPLPVHQALPDGVRQAVFWLLLGLVCGVAGSVVDSVLGATVQYSGYDTATGKVVSQPGGASVKHVSGRPWLSNDAVNATSAFITSLAAGAVGASIVSRAVAL